MMAIRSRILVIDDENTYRLMLSEYLRREGFEVHSAPSGEAAVELLKREPFDLLIVDLQLEGMGGMDVVKAVSEATPEMAIIVLTAQGTLETAVQALRYRVQDYLDKTVNPREIITSVHRALESKGKLRRMIAERTPLTYRQISPRVFEINAGVVIDFNRRRVLWDDNSVTLTSTEDKILQLLIERVNHYVSHTELVYKALGYELNAEEAARILRPLISRLRKKLALVPGGYYWIKSLRGEGYMFEIG